MSSVIFRNNMRTFKHKSESFSSNMDYESDSNPSLEQEITFHPFTRDSKAKGKSVVQNEEDSQLKQGLRLPFPFHNALPLALVNTLLEDIDPFYNNKRTFIVINKNKNIFRFSATNALWLLSPFNPLRRMAIYMLIHPLFTVLINATIIVNGFFMVFHSNPSVQSMKAICTAIYTLEIIVKVVARGFILQPFTYLRDAWNWLDFVITILAYVAINVDLGQVAALETLRMLHLLPIAAVIPGLNFFTKCMMESMMESLKRLKGVIILTIFLLFVFATIGLQLYKGLFTRKCVKNFPTDGSWGNLTAENWARFVSNETNWFSDEDRNKIKLCGNSSGTHQCKTGYVCLQGFGGNPNYGYTNFDTFGWALVSIFRLITRDHWEGLYELVSNSGGPWHVTFFIVIIFFVSFNITNLILTSVAICFDEVSKQRKEEKYAEEIEMRLQNETATGEDIKTTSSKWNCCQCWVTLQKLAALVVFDPFIQLYSTVCIILNTIFLTSHHHNMDAELARILTRGSHFCIFIFVIEIIMKMIALNPKTFFQKQSNIFDFTVVALALVGLGFNSIQGLSIIRSLTLLKFIRLARSQYTLNLYLSLMVKSVNNTMKLTFISCIVIFIFALLGMHLFGKDYLDYVDRFSGSQLPRWNFTDLMHSFLLIFRVFCGEWIESMWDCVLVGGAFAIPFFIAAVIVCRFVIANFFLSTVLSDYGSLSLPPHDSDVDRIMEALSRIGGFIKWMKTKIIRVKVNEQMSNRVEESTARRIDEDNSRTIDDSISHDSKEQSISDIVEESTTKRKDEDNSRVLDNSICHDDSEEQSLSELELNEDCTSTQDVKTHPPPCFPKRCYNKLPILTGNKDSPFCRTWSYIRHKAFNLVKSKYFEGFVITTILFSSLALTLEDVHLSSRPHLQSILHHMDAVFVGLLLVETLVIWLGSGLKQYFTNPWYLLDFVVLTVLLISFFGNIKVLNAVRILRLLRLLRPTLRFTTARAIIGTLANTWISILLALFACLTVWLIFAVVGVHTFAGKFWKCVKTNKTVLNFEVIPDVGSCKSENYSWENSRMNFDNVGNAYLSLFEVAIFKGWIQIMTDAIDSIQTERQSTKEINIYIFLYFMVFIIFGSFFTMNLFIVVIFEQYREKTLMERGSELFFFEENERRRELEMKVYLKNKKPLKAIPKPRWKPQIMVFEMVTNKKFEMIILIVIGLNILTMATDHYQATETFILFLDYLNLTFVIVFTIECLLKIFALRCYYFKDLWNLFDLILVVLSHFQFVASNIIEKYLISPALIPILRVMRVVKIRSCLRSIKWAKHIQKPYLILSASLRPLLFVCFLLFLVMFIYAIFGMFLFMNVKGTNFKTFGQSMILLLPLSTSAGWDEVLNAVTNQENSIMGYIYLLSFFFFCYIIFSTYTAAIINNYNQIDDDLENGLIEEDFDMFFEIWQQFDPEATQYIPYIQLSDFLAELKPPLQIPKPNKYNIISMNIPICKGELMFYSDVLDAAIHKFFQEYCDFESKVEVRIKNQVDCGTVSFTLRRQQEERCASLIQKMWRRRRCTNSDEIDANEEVETQQSVVVVESDGFVTRNGHKVMLTSPTSSICSKFADDV